MTQDGIEQAYEELLPWSLFSLRLNNSLSQIANLAPTFGHLTPQERATDDMFAMVKEEQVPRWQRECQHGY